jgi:hypothetical protein
MTVTLLILNYQKKKSSSIQDKKSLKIIEQNEPGC